MKPTVSSHCYNNFFQNTNNISLVFFRDKHKLFKAKKDIYVKDKKSCSYLSSFCSDHYASLSHKLVILCIYSMSIKWFCNGNPEHRGLENKTLPLFCISFTTYLDTFCLVSAFSVTSSFSYLPWNVLTASQTVVTEIIAP